MKTKSGRELRDALDDYYRIRVLAESTDAAESEREQPRLVSRYYDVVTEFYERAWGQSFHFSPRRRGETLAASQRRHEEGIGRRLRLQAGMEVADVGCGVGGPMVTIARATGARVTGLNCNARQIARGEERVGKAGLQDRCRFLLENFVAVRLPDDHFHAAYSFESICHAPSSRAVFDELHRLLKPGGEIAAVDWCLTSRFDEDDPVHRGIRDRIEFANATPDLLTTDMQEQAAVDAGFEILETGDQAAAGDPETPWYMALQGHDISLASLARVPAGRWLTASATSLLERLRIAPAGTGEAARLLNVAADALVEGGETGIFTPSFLVHAHKPETAGRAARKSSLSEAA